MGRTIAPFFINFPTGVAAPLGGVNLFKPVSCDPGTKMLVAPPPPEKSCHRSVCQRTLNGRVNLGSYNGKMYIGLVSDADSLRFSAPRFIGQTNGTFLRYKGLTSERT
jgi:hypothetical protein